jgi:hypothetical protein
MLVLKIGRGFELDVQFWSSVYLRVGHFERFWNRYGLPSGSANEGPVGFR